MVAKKRKRGVAAAFTALICLALSVFLAFIGVGLKYDRIEREAQRTESAHRINAFYYNHLTYKQQQLYDLILNAVQKRTDETDMLPYVYSNADFALVIDYIRADHPELFYLDFNGFQMLSATHATRVELAYLYDIETTAKMQNEISAAIVYLTSDIEPVDSEQGGEFEAERLIHDRFVHACTYAPGDESGKSTVYSALVLGSADAYGYAGAMKLLLEEFDIYSILVFGETAEGDHVWNIVYADGKFYHLDALWNDADLEFAEDIVFHGYFNLSSAAISKDHTMRDAELMPEAVDDGDYYFSRGLFVHNTMELDRIAYREILGAGYTGNEFFELYPDFDIEIEGFRDSIIDVIKRINNIQDDFVFKEIFRVYRAAEGSGAVTIQLYYDKKIEASVILPEEDENLIEADEQE